MKIWNILLLLTILLMTGIANAATITVDNSGGADYTKIQDAINAANVGDTIEVRSGTYYETINVNKKLVLIGKDIGGGKPVIDANRVDSPITLSSDGTTLSGFKIINSGAMMNSASEPEAGIKIVSSNNIISNNSVSLNNNYGIYVLGYSNLIMDNDVYLSHDGIYIDELDYNNITHNTVSNNYCGICTYATINNKIIDNDVYNNNRGVMITSSEKMTLKNNRIFNNDHNFGVAGEYSSSYDHNIDISNTVDGKPIYYIKNVNNQIYDETTNAGVFYCINCDHVTIKALETKNNWAGIVLVMSQNSIIENNLIMNDQTGVLLRSSSNNNITNNVISTNFGYGIGTGIYLGPIIGSDNSNGNNINNNDVYDNQHGIITLASINNIIFNNIFNNNVDDYVSFGGANNNIWNISKQNNTNIIGGSNIGGNLWLKQDGSGISQTCTNRGDGFCNVSYSLDSNNIDYLPLTNSTSICDNTPTGEDVFIFPHSDVNIGFNAVTQCGNTTISVSDNQWGPLPDGYVPIKFYNIETTATYIGPVSIRINYQNSDIPSNVDESSIVLFHYENGEWLNVAESYSVIGNYIVGISNSLSPFGFAGIDTETPTATPTIIPTSTTTPIEIPTVSPTQSVSPTVIPISGNVVRGSSFDITGIMILSLCLIMIGLLKLKTRRK